MKFFITLSFLTIFATLGFAEVVPTPDAEATITATTSLANSIFQAVLIIGVTILAWTFIQKRFRDMSRHT
jgi:hypothetical protein